MISIRLEEIAGKLGWIALAVVGFIALSGCDATIIPPLNPQRPTAVYLCNYGVHSSLLLPISRGKYVEFLYGDWNWAALGHTGACDAIEALFFSQQSTLGRRFVAELPGETMPRPIDGPITETCLTVNGAGCTEVVAKLMARWELHRLTAKATGSEFSYAKDDVHYSWAHDCNAMTADCLQQMGCRVDGIPLWSNFKIAEPTP